MLVSIGLRDELSLIHISTFLPVEIMKPRALREDHQVVCQSTPGYLGVMSDFVRYQAPIESVVLNQLGHIIPVSYTHLRIYW